MTDREQKMKSEENQAPENGSERTMEKIRKSEKSVRRYQWFVLRLLLLIAVIWVLFFKVIGLTHMPSGDMSPRLDAGDMVLFYRLDTDVRAQDVIVIEKATPQSGSNAREMFVSRVVAAGGDTVEISGGRLIINGSTMIEPNIYFSTPAFEGYTEYPVTLAADECFVLGDNREEAADSRYFGAVKKDEIQGTVITVIRRNKL